jgi:transposase-like protein
MGDATQRRWTAEEKLQILDEARKTGQTVSEVCRRHQVALGQFYTWEEQVRQAALAALRNGKRGRKPAKTKADLHAEITRLGRRRRAQPGDAGAQKGALAIATRRRYTEEEKATILQTVGTAHEQSGAPVRALLQPLGLPRATYYNWVTRRRWGS